MIQPSRGGRDGASDELYTVGCAGRLTRFVETGDGRYLVTLTGVADSASSRSEPLRTTRTGRVASRYDEFAGISTPARAPTRSTAKASSRRCANSRKVRNSRWTGRASDAAPTETLVNALAMMSPFGANDKQALVEAY